MAPLDLLSSGVTKMAPLLFYSLSFLETYYQQDVWTQNPFMDKAGGGGGGSLAPPSMPKVRDCQKASVEESVFLVKRNATVYL